MPEAFLRSPQRFLIGNKIRENIEELKPEGDEGNRKAARSGIPEIRGSPSLLCGSGPYSDWQCGFINIFHPLEERFKKSLKRMGNGWA
jgi:hypothetical protein